MPCSYFWGKLRRIPQNADFAVTEFSEVRAVMLTGMRRSGGITWLVAPGLATIAVTYGLARFAYGLFLPEMRESLDLSDSVLGLIGAGSYAGDRLAVLGALVLTSRSGPRLMALLVTRPRPPSSRCVRWPAVTRRSRGR